MTEQTNFNDVEPQPQPQAQTHKVTIKGAVEYFNQKPLRLKKLVDKLDYESLEILNRCISEQLVIKKQQAEEQKRMEMKREQERLDLIKLIEESGFAAKDLFNKRKNKKAEDI